jgi:hypothetical protein
MYSREDCDALKLATDFKKTFSIDVSIDFVGVWFVISDITARLFDRLLINPCTLLGIPSAALASSPATCPL